MLFGKVHANNDILWVGWWMEGLNWTYSALCKKKHHCINLLIPLRVILVFRANFYLECLIYMVVLALKRIYLLIKHNTSIDSFKNSFFEDNLLQVCEAANAAWRRHKAAVCMLTGLLRRQQHACLHVGKIT